jgi:hypothetical protein
MSRVPVDKLRAEVQASGLDPYELAALMGWRDKRGWIDTARVNRILGLTRYAEGHGHGPAIRQGVNWATAQTIRHALDDYAEQRRSRNPDQITGGSQTDHVRNDRAS